MTRVRLAGAMEREKHWLVAVLSVRLGEEDAALEALEKAHTNRSPVLANLPAAAQLAPLQDEPRFRRLVKMLGLPQPQGD